MIPVQNLPFAEVVLYAYAADRTPYPTYVCLPSGLYKARNGQIVAQTGPNQESYLCQACTSSMDGGYTERYQSPVTYPAPRSASQRYHSRRTLSQYGANPVARRRSERHPSDSRQESGGKRAKYKADSCPRM